MQEPVARPTADADRHRRLLDVLPDAVFVNTDGKVAWCNPAFARLLGAADAAALAGRAVADVFHPDYHAAIGARIAAMLATDRPVPPLYERVVRLDGRCVPVLVTATPIADGGRQAIAVVLRDLDEHARALRADAIARLAAAVAHDFNNLLTVITGHCELLLARLPQGAPHRTEIGMVHDAGQRAARLVRQLLTLSSRPAASATSEVTAIAQTIAECDPMLRRLLGDRIELRLSLSPPLDARIDAGLLQQVLLNLAANAAEAMVDGGRVGIAAAAVQLDAAAAAAVQLAPGRYVQLEFQDSGCGMDAAVAASAFEPFFSTKTAGSGLGLAVVHGVVQQCGGQVRIDSAPGAGTTVRLWLPAAEAGPAAAPAPAPVRGGETVLLVEDEEPVREVICASLQREGYRVLAAASGRAALALAQQHAGGIDLLLTDVIMPEMNGRELAAALRQLQPGLRVLFVSGYTDDVLLGQAAGDEPPPPLLEKPFTPQVLAAKVRAVLAG